MFESTGALVRVTPSLDPGRAVTVSKVELSFAVLTFLSRVRTFLIDRIPTLKDRIAR
jgi:hypothetical protein